MQATQGSRTVVPESVGLTVVNAYEIYMKDLPPTKWYVGEILQEGATLLSGDPKVGKSFLALQIAIAVAGRSDRVCGSLSVGIHGRVLYLALDDGSEKRIHGRFLPPTNVVHLSCDQKPAHYGNMRRDHSTKSQ
jgi:AAA domain